MTPAKALYPTERRIYHPELTHCPHCGTPTALLNYLTCDKIVQTLTTALALAVRPSHCPDPACPGFPLRLRSIPAQHLALPGGTYGRDVIARLGWLRQEQALTFTQVQAALAPTVQISETHVRTLYHEAYLPLLAASIRRHHAALTRLADQHGGLLLACDGLAPQGGEPQLWCVYELLTGLLLRAGWVSQVDQPTFERFLQPLAATWPVRAVLSDKQQGLEAAIGTVFPRAAHQLCQAHFICRLADPIAPADAQLGQAVRQAVRAGLGPALRVEAPTATASSGILTVTGLLPAPLPAAALDADSPPADTQRANELVAELLRRVRYLLSLNGHQPERWAGLEMVMGLEEVRQLSRELLAHRSHADLTVLAQTLDEVLRQAADRVAGLRQAVRWLTDIQTLRDPARTPAFSGAAVAADLSAYLGRLAHQAGADEFLIRLMAHMRAVSRRYWGSLFHTYDQPGLPRTNNGLESRFRDVRRRLRRTTGQAGATAEQLQRLGAWELVSRAASEAEQGAVFASVAVAEWQQERARVRQHQARFRLHSRKGPRARPVGRSPPAVACAPSRDRVTFALLHKLDDVCGYRSRCADVGPVAATTLAPAAPRKAVNAQPVKHLPRLTCCLPLFTRYLPASSSTRNVSAAQRAQVKAAARVGPRAVRSARTAGVVSTRSKAAVQAAGSCGSISRAASPVTSGSEEALAASNGAPQASASSAGRPKPSYSDGSVTAAAPLISTGRSASAT